MAEACKPDARDSGPIQFGPEYYVMCRMADPAEPVRVVGSAPPGPSVIDGRMTMRYLARSARGCEFVVEPWQLSRVPPDELYASLRSQRSPMVVPVVSVRLSA